jgi:hypothetical protein
MRFFPHVSLQRIIDYRVTNGLHFKSKTPYQEAQRKSPISFLTGHLYLLSDEAMKHSKYALKAHLGQLEYTSALPFVRFRAKLLKQAPPDHEFHFGGMNLGTLNERQRRKGREALVRHVRRHKKQIYENIRLAQTDRKAINQSIEAGDGIETVFTDIFNQLLTISSHLPPNNPYKSPLANSNQQP